MESKPERWFNGAANDIKPHEVRMGIDDTDVLVVCVSKGRGTKKAIRFGMACLIL
ncbi:hypothetical protein [Parapedobacter sp. DT-150]|uniref:hypothetical protein n=1 Tax=Parapedobacter sp. DT-150 TaxID=3396162 RepID=UPI003F1A06E1